MKNHIANEICIIEKLIYWIKSKIKLILKISEKINKKKIKTQEIFNYEFLNNFKIF